jgi:hypothetical protein
MPGGRWLRSSDSGPVVEWSSGRVTVGIYDAGGRRVLAQVSRVGRQASGVTLDLRALSAGVYVVRLDAGGCHACQKLVLQ